MKKLWRWFKWKLIVKRKIDKSFKQAKEEIYKSMSIAMDNEFRKELNGLDFITNDKQEKL